MHCSFGRAVALFVIGMKDQPLLRDLKTQFNNTATPQVGAAEILCAYAGATSVRLQYKQTGSN
jgi:hypothetical protein